MTAITSKASITAITATLLHTYRQSGTEAFLKQLHSEILKKKVRFPLLEYTATILYKEIPFGSQAVITDEIISLNEMGGNVLAGIILQLRLERALTQSIGKAVEYIIVGNEWYVCDIIGERVIGHALLTMPEKCLPIIRKLSRHDDKWIVRAVGVAAHYAVKKGLDRKYVSDLFLLLLSLGHTTDFHSKKGIGWAVKTIAKFHPAAIEQYREEIESERTKQWFKTKIKIGLSRTEKYAHKYNR